MQRLSILNILRVPLKLSKSKLLTLYNYLRDGEQPKKPERRVDPPKPFPKRREVDSPTTPSRRVNPPEPFPKKTKR
jgi:hypothetical protein